MNSLMHRISLLFLVFFSTIALGEPIVESKPPKTWKKRACELKDFLQEIKESVDSSLNGIDPLLLMGTGLIGLGASAYVCGGKEFEGLKGMYNHGTNFVSVTSSTLWYSIPFLVTGYLFYKGYSQPTQSSPDSALQEEQELNAVAREAK